MKKYINFTCPTDCLESIIKGAFSGEHYFFTSLGNSMTFDKGSVGQIKELIKSKNIHEISFILSDDNRFVDDALEDQEFSNLTGLENFYEFIEREKENLGEIWQEGNRQFLLISHHLNHKIEELKREMDEPFVDQYVFKARIYKRKEDIFREIYPVLILQENLNLN